MDRERDMWRLPDDAKPLVVSEHRLTPEQVLELGPGDELVVSWNGGLAHPARYQVTDELALKRLGPRLDQGIDQRFCHVRAQHQDPSRDRATLDNLARDVAAGTVAAWRSWGEWIQAIAAERPAWCERFDGLARQHGFEPGVRKDQLEVRKLLAPSVYYVHAFPLATTADPEVLVGEAVNAFEARRAELGLC